MLEHWNLIQLDLHDRFGIDTGDRALMAARPWSWLQLRVRDLISADSRLRRALAPS